MDETGVGAGAPAAADGTDPPAPRTAGGLLKAARQREKLHLAVLAATIKVAPAKLEALEQDRYDALPNPTFTRALAQSVCRSLKIDPRPVLALLPQVEMAALEGSVGRLNTPFHERPARTDGGGLAWATKPMFWAGGLLLVAAGVVGLLPPDLVSRWTEGSSVADALPAAAGGPGAAPLPDAASAAAGASATLAASAVLASAGAASATLAAGPSAAPEGPSTGADAAPTAASAGSTDGMASAPSTAAVAAVAAVAGSAARPDATKEVASGPGLLRLSASADSWIEVIDAGGQAVFSRVLQGGESVAVNPRPPLRVRVGNVSGTTLAFRGKVFDLTPFTRDNVARVELR